MEAIKVGVIGLGYVGLPLAVSFSKHFDIVGFDVKKSRIEELKSGLDSTGEVESEALKSSSQILSCDIADLADCNIYIVTVPTPVRDDKTPDLSPLVSASNMLATVIAKGDIVIYESTVYPGATEEVCVPILEKESGLRFNRDFYVGYSPERINPGDKDRTFEKILKVTSGSTPEIAHQIDELYSRVVTAGTFKASSIKVAEAAKVIENTQRDLNIALINELALIFDKLNIDTYDVLEAASTKWNFLNFKPGLVGGHCIGVDPYYLTYKAQAVGYHPEIVLSGRRLNDNMYLHVCTKVVKEIIKRGKVVNKARVLVMGATFKENCPDLRNSKVFDVIDELGTYGIDVAVFDPVCDFDELLAINAENVVQSPEKGAFDAIVLAVPHHEFLETGDYVQAFLSDNGVIFDLKGVLQRTSEVIRF